MHNSTKQCRYCGKEIITDNELEYCNYKCKVEYEIKEIKKKKHIQNEVKKYIQILVEYLINRSQIEGDVTEEGHLINYYHVEGFNTRIKEQILERDNYACQICGKDTQLHVHHIIPRIQGGNHNSENLITLCASCHACIESKDVIRATSKCYKNFLKNGPKQSKGDKKVLKMSIRLKLEEILEMLTELEESCYMDKSKKDTLLEMLEIIEEYDE